MGMKPRVKPQKIQLADLLRQAWERATSNKTKSERLAMLREAIQEARKRIQEQENSSPQRDKA